MKSEGVAKLETAQVFLLTELKFKWTTAYWIQVL